MTNQTPNETGFFTLVDRKATAPDIFIRLFKLDMLNFDRTHGDYVSLVRGEWKNKHIFIERKKAEIAMNFYNNFGGHWKHKCEIIEHITHPTNLEIIKFNSDKDNYDYIVKRNGQGIGFISWSKVDEDFIYNRSYTKEYGRGEITHHKTIADALIYCAADATSRELVKDEEEVSE